MRASFCGERSLLREYPGDRLERDSYSYLMIRDSLVALFGRRHVCFGFCSQNADTGFQS